MIPMPDRHQDDSAPLLARIAEGDEVAFRDLYEQMSPAAYGLALRVTRDEHLAQDVLQEAFDRGLVERPSLRSQDRERPGLGDPC